MSEKHLNFLILFFLLTAVSGAFIIIGDFFGNALAMKYIKYIFMVAFGVAPLLLVIKAMSRLLLHGIKGRPISFVQNTFALYYLVLTKEARKEWREYIEERKTKSV